VRVITDVESVEWQIRQQEEYKITGKWNEDTPISKIGWQQAEDVCSFLMKDVQDLGRCAVVASPWLRTIQTASSFAAVSKAKICLEPAVGEEDMYCSGPPPAHHKSSDFKHLIDHRYEGIMRNGEMRDEELNSVTEAFFRKFKYTPGNTTVIFSHAGTSVRLVAGLSGRSITEIAACAPCARWKLQRNNEGKFKVVENGRICHLSVFGETAPHHPEEEVGDMFAELDWPPPPPKNGDEGAQQCPRVAYFKKYHSHIESTSSS